jgi:hypothetical protein
LRHRLPAGGAASPGRRRAGRPGLAIGSLIPAHATEATVEGSRDNGQQISFEIPAHSRLKVDTPPAQSLRTLRYRPGPGKPSEPRDPAAALNNKTDHTVVVDLWFLQSPKLNDGLGDTPTYYHPNLSVRLTRSWDPASQEPKPKAAPMSAEAVAALPEVRLTDLTVAYRPKNPVYPPAALAARAEAGVDLVIAVNRHGRPVDVRSQGGTPELREAAEAYGWRWVFLPPQGDRAVQVPVRVTFRLP